MRVGNAVAIGAVAGLVAFGCSSDGGEVATTGDVPEEEPSSDAEGDAEGNEVTESPVVGEFTTFIDPADPASPTLVPEGTAAAWWYTAGDVYAVVYTGLVGAGLADPLCPGNSIRVADGSFEFVSNAETEPGDCGSIEVDPGATARVCDSVIVYTTIIPTDTEGVLTASFGGVEAGQGGGLAEVDADLDATPEIDPEASAYVFPASMVTDGEVTC